MRHEIPTQNWTAALADALRQAGDGDEVVVRTAAAAELARRAIQRMRPGVSITVVVEKEE